MPPIVIRKHRSSGFQYRVNNSRIDPAALSSPAFVASMTSSLSDSSMVRRSQNTTTAATPPSAKPMRQPKSCNWSSLRNASSTNSVNCASTCPPTSVTYWKLEKKPRRSRVAASDMYVADVPYSPPVANPCTRRASTRTTGAATPIVACDGTSAITMEQNAISDTLTVSAARRPRRSANRPKNHDPTGRITKVTAKIAYTYTVEFFSDSSKNCPSKYEANTV